VVTRAITATPGRDVCHVCKTPFTSEEGCYLAYCNTSTMTLAEFKSLQEEAVAKRRAELASLSSSPLQLPNCSGICKSGKNCAKVAMRSSGVFCNLHVPK